MFSHHNMSDDTEIINSDLNSNDESNAEIDEKKEIKELETQFDNSSNAIENIVEDNDENDIDRGRFSERPVKPGEEIFKRQNEYVF